VDEWRGASAAMVVRGFWLVLPDTQLAHDGVSDHADVAFHFMRVLAS
jgi:hypothetical protein